MLRANTIRVPIDGSRPRCARRGQGGSCFGSDVTILFPPQTGRQDQGTGNSQAQNTQVHPDLSFRPRHQPAPRSWSVGLFRRMRAQAHSTRACAARWGRVTGINGDLRDLKLALQLNAMFIQTQAQLQDAIEQLEQENFRQFPSGATSFMLFGWCCAHVQSSLLCGWLLQASVAIAAPMPATARSTRAMYPSGSSPLWPWPSASRLFCSVASWEFD